MKNTLLTGVFGGSFDPIHNGHVALAMAAIKEVNLDRLIVMPTKVQPFKRDKKVTDDFHRLNMVRLAFEDVPTVQVSDYEIRHTKVSYTHATLNHLKTIYPDDKIYFIMGTDSMLTLEKWYKGEELLRDFSFIVSYRPGYKEHELDEKIRYYENTYGTEIVKILSVMPDVSSTEIRNLCEEEQSIAHLVPEKVERYIHAERLY